MSLWLLDHMHIHSRGRLLLSWGAVALSMVWHTTGALGSCRKLD